MEETEDLDIENNFEDDDDDDVVFIESLDRESKQEKAKLSLEVIDLTDAPDDVISEAVAPVPTSVANDDNPILSTIKDILPDADPAYLQRKVNELTTDAQLHDFILTAVSQQNYPKINLGGTAFGAAPGLPVVNKGVGTDIAEEVMKFPCLWSEQLEFLLHDHQRGQDVNVPPVSEPRDEVLHQQTEEYLHSLDQLFQDVAEVTRNHVTPYSRPQQFQVYPDGGHENVLTSTAPKIVVSSGGDQDRYPPTSSLSPTFNIYQEEKPLLHVPPFSVPQKSTYYVAEPTVTKPLDLRNNFPLPSTSKVPQPDRSSTLQVKVEGNGYADLQSSTLCLGTTIGSVVPRPTPAFVTSAPSTITSSRDVPQIGLWSTSLTPPTETELAADSYASSAFRSDHSYASSSNAVSSLAPNDLSVAGSSSQYLNVVQDATFHKPPEATPLNCKLLPRPTVISHTIPYSRPQQMRANELRELEMTYRSKMPKPTMFITATDFPQQLLNSNDQMENAPTSLHSPVDPASISQPLSLIKEPVPRPVTFANALPFIQPPSVIKKEPLLLPNLISDTPTSNFSIQNNVQFPSPSRVAYAPPTPQPRLPSPPVLRLPPLPDAPTVPYTFANPSAFRNHNHQLALDVDRQVPVLPPTSLAVLDLNQKDFEPINLTKRAEPQRSPIEPRPAVVPRPAFAPGPALAPRPAFAPRPALVPRPALAPRPALEPRPAVVPRPAVDPRLPVQPQPLIDPRRPVQPRPQVEPIMPHELLMHLDEILAPPVEQRAHGDNAHDPERDLYELQGLFNIRERRRRRLFERRIHFRHAHAYILGGLQAQMIINRTPKVASTSRQRTEAEEKMSLISGILFGADPAYLRKEVVKLQNAEDIDKFLIRAFTEEDIWQRSCGREGSSQKPAAKKTLESKLKILMKLLPEASPTFLKRECVNLNSDEELQEFASKVLHDQNYPKRKTGQTKKDNEEVIPIETATSSPTKQLNKIYLTLVDMLPDADPDYLYEQSKKLTDVESFILQAVEEKSYPKRDQLFKRQEYQKLWKKYIEKFDIKEFLLLYPNPIKYFYMEKKNSKSPLDIPLKFLQHRYRRKDVDAFAFIYSKENQNLTKTCDRLDFHFSSKPRMLQVWDGEAVFSTAVLQEIAFIQNRREIAHYLLFQQNMKAEAIAKAREEGTLQECGCCFEEKLPEDMMMCNADHAFCKTCVKRGSDVVIGNGGTRFPCYSDGCEEEFSLSVIQNILTPEVFSRLLIRKQYEEVSAAGIPGLETCSFCEFCSIPPPEDKLFRCLNPSCMKITCRKCKKLDHLPLSCEEFTQKETQNKMQNYVEEQMTEALVRSCWKCGAKFVKESGCNMMTCKCGAKMCYACRKPVKDYDHFTTTGCGQNMDTTPQDVKNVIDTGKRAMEEMEAANPGFQLINDPTKLLNLNKSVHKNT